MSRRSYELQFVEWLLEAGFQGLYGGPLDPYGRRTLSEPGQYGYGTPDQFVYPPGAKLRGSRSAYGVDMEIIVQVPSGAFLFEYGVTIWITGEGSSFPTQTEFTLDKAKTAVERAMVELDARYERGFSGYDGGPSFARALEEVLLENGFARDAIGVWRRIGSNGGADVVVTQHYYGEERQVLLRGRRDGVPTWTQSVGEATNIEDFIPILQKALVMQDHEEENAFPSPPKIVQLSREVQGTCDFPRCERWAYPFGIEGGDGYTVACAVHARQMYEEEHKQ